MEALLLIAIAIYVYKTTVQKESYVEVANLKVGTNKNGLYDETAFTEVYMIRKENRDNAKEV